MAQLGKQFDSNGKEDMNSGFDPVPAGEYKVMIVESDMKTTKKKDGKFLEIKMKILDGEFNGRFIWSRMNIENPNPVAVEIAEKELATLCRAVGKGAIQDSNELHAVPFIVKVKVTKGSGDFPPANEPVNYVKIGAAQTPPDEAGADIGQGQVEPDSDEVPWE